MPSDTLSMLGERILLALWKSSAVGTRSVGEDVLRTQLADSSDSLTQELETLQTLGFILRSNGRNEFSLTPIGLAILRQIEEDKLQELR